MRSSRWKGPQAPMSCAAAALSRQSPTRLCSFRDSSCNLQSQRMRSWRKLLLIIAVRLRCSVALLALSSSSRKACCKVIASASSSATSLASSCSSVCSTSTSPRRLSRVASRRRSSACNSGSSAKVVVYWYAGKAMLARIVKAFTSPAAVSAAAAASAMGARNSEGNVSASTPAMAAKRVAKLGSEKTCLISSRVGDRRISRQHSSRSASTGPRSSAATCWLSAFFISAYSCLPKLMSWNRLASISCLVCSSSCSAASTLLLCWAQLFTT
mmetsp:Transcript_27961/g.66375  ORF Transcript_27961/g.66375 Transcript_27961/m.66375 type:complete len:270 (+) Transcript_27961:1244-2053(+)